jgi:hypothetical protein
MLIGTQTHKEIEELKEQLYTVVYDLIEYLNAEAILEIVEDAIEDSIACEDYYLH